MSKTLVPNTVAENEPFLRRPTETNPHFGITKFIETSEMKEGGRYVVNDTAYLSVTVDLSALKDPFNLSE